MFARRGYHAARVDDVVRAARTSHGTFYLYFANKEDLLRALAVDCAHRLTDLADRRRPDRRRRGRPRPSCTGSSAGSSTPTATTGR